MWQCDERGLCQATVCTLFFCCPNYHKGCTLHQVKERGTGGPDGGQNHVDQVCFGCPIVTNSWLRWNGNSDGDVTVRDVMRVMAVWNEVGNQFIRPRFISIVMRCFHRLVPSILLKPWKNEYFPQAVLWISTTEKIDKLLFVCWSAPEK